jgi:hypothetical protein
MNQYFASIQFAVVLAVCTAQTADATDTSVRYTGVNIAGGDFAAENLPGTYGRDYIYPDPNTIAYFAAKGISIIRVPALWEPVTCFRIGAAFVFSPSFSTIATSLAGPAPLAGGMAALEHWPKHRHRFCG